MCSSDLLTYHREAGRDVFGISEDGIDIIRRKSLRDWMVFKRSGLVAPAVPPLRGIAPPAIPAPPPGRVSTRFATPGLPGVTPPARGVPMGAMTERQLRTFMKERAPAAVPARPGQYTRLIAHVWNIPPRPPMARGAVVPTGPAPRPKPIPTPKPVPKPPPPPPPKPPEPPKPPPRPAERVPRVGYRRIGEIPEGSATAIRAAIDAMPEKVKRTLVDAEINFVHARRWVDYDPEFATRRPRGWSEGMTWEYTDGAFHGGRNEILVTHEKRSTGGEYVTSRRQLGVLHHETGHGFDAALGASRSDEFIAAYEADVAALPEQSGAMLEYYLQPGVAGHREAFAEVFAGLMGEGADWMDVGRTFPRVLDHIRELLR